MLSLHTDRINDVVIIECKGRIVHSEAAFALRSAVISQDDARLIFLDLSEVSAIEGGGLGMVLFLRRWAQDHDIRLKLFNPTKFVWDRLELAHSMSELEVATPDEMQAVLGNAHMRSAA
jgi:anti-anti-sigma regulatory factor